ncbi:MAG TPA: adenylate/guanylate cyclase domain-containing protein [Actinomycetota bacterium]|nr:adenylate/guanylate cyclase domain-containing protein [Actinomycetota bacterium]
MTEESRPGRRLIGVLVVLAPLIVLFVVKAAPDMDRSWEDPRAHFWVVLLAAILAVVLGYSVATGALRRRDARLLLISAGFLAAAGFLGLHALATPGVLVDTNTGFEYATPVGLLLGGLFVAWSAQPLEETGEHIIRRANLLLSGVAAVIVLWAIFSLAGLPPFDKALSPERIELFQTSIGGAGLILYTIAAWGYLKLYRERKARLLFALTLAFALLAETMVVVAFALNWRVSWWEWHVLMFAAFLLMSLAARAEWYEERFATVYQQQTLLGQREVSILFADLQGYTSFSESHTPEEVVQMLNEYFDRLVPLMTDLGGVVHQIIGDALMVTFNQYGDKPDHALLAARAALALQREGAEIAGRAEGRPRFRVGVNTGWVITGVVGGERGHRKHAVVGDPVNLAARLESSATVGEVVIGEETYSRLPAGAEVEEMEPLQLKGKAKPVRAYRLLGLPDA